MCDRKDVCRTGKIAMMTSDAKISVLVPTRQRPESLQRMLTSLRSTSERPDLLEVVVYIDEDDMQSLQLDLAEWNVKRLVGPRRTMGALNTACLERAGGSIIILGNDDIVVRTPGWDRKIRGAAQEYSNEIYLLYPNDLFKKSKLASFPILSKSACDAIGDPFPAAYRGAFIDVHLMDIFKKLERCGHSRIKYLEEVVFEHMHHRLGKSELDTTYRNRSRVGDDDAFLTLALERTCAAARLAGVISGRAAVAANPNSGPNTISSRVFATWRLLLDSHSPVVWRLRLFTWMSLRLVYRYLTGQVGPPETRPPASTQ